MNRSTRRVVMRADRPLPLFTTRDEELRRLAELRDQAAARAGIPPKKPERARPMTWGDFKAAMEARGVRDGDEMQHIDVSLQFAPGDFAVEFTTLLVEQGRRAFNAHD